MEVNSTKPPWVRIFEDVILIAFKKLMNDYRAWGLNQLDQDIDKMELYRGDFATNFLLETTVTSYIFSEFINSPLTTGIYINKEFRSFRISREICFKDALGKGKNKIVDFAVSRIHHFNGKYYYPRLPALIEAKKASNYRIDFDRNNLTGTANNKSGISDDIDALMKISISNHLVENSMNYPEAKGYFPYILIWDLVQDENFENHTKIINYLKSYSKKAGKNKFGLKKGTWFRDIESRIHWLPVDFDRKEAIISLETNSTYEPSVPKVKTWLWFLLAEVYDFEYKLDTKFPDDEKKIDLDVWAEIKF